MIAIGILTHNRRAQIGALLYSLAGLKTRVVVLDQGSTDGTQVDLMRRKSDLILSPRNLGCAGGRARLVEYVKPGPADIMVFLDDDICIENPWWLRRLIEPLERPEIGISGVDGRRITTGGLSEPEPHIPGPVEYVSGGWCAVRGAVFASGCAFDLRFNPNYYEDADLCYQARLEGFGVWCVGDIGLRHEPHVNGETPDLIKRNAALFCKKWGF